MISLENRWEETIDSKRCCNPSFYQQRKLQLTIRIWIMRTKPPLNLRRKPRGSRRPIHRELAIFERHLSNLLPRAHLYIIGFS